MLRHRPHIRMLFATLVASVLAGAMPATAQAPAPVTVKAAQDLLVAMGSARQFEAVLPLIMQQTRALMVQGRPEIGPKVDEVMPILMARFSARKAELLDDIAIAYARKISLADLEAATAFFSSDAGKRFVSLQPELTQEAMQIGQRWGATIGRQIYLELRQELKKRGIDL